MVRLLDTNLAQLAATIIYASSQDTAATASKLRDQSLGATYRSLGGWVIIAGFNDDIDFNRGGVKVASIAPGWYPTAASLCAAIVAALEAADAGQGWACVYIVSTFKFTISATPTFTLLFLTGVNAATSVHLCLGYTSTDKSAATSQPAENAAYQSRHYLLFDLGSAMAVTAGVVRHHNAGAGGTFTLYADTAANPWVAPDLTQTLAGDSDIRLAFFGSTSKRYWALVVNDVQNSLGYAEIGIVYVGTYRQPSVPNSINFEEERDDRSSIDFALSGANYQSRRQRQRGWAIEWLELADADRLILEAWGDATAKGTNFFIAFDAVTTPTDTRYCFRDVGLRKLYVPGNYWNFSTHLVEAVP